MKTNRFLWWLAILPLACGGADERGEALDLDSAWALVVTTDYQTGALSAVRLRDQAVGKNLHVVHPDAVCRTDALAGQPFLISRMGADAISFVQARGPGDILGEYSVGIGSNPQDLALGSASRAYVPRYAESTLLVVDPQTGEELDSVDLSSYADSDGVPEASWAVTVEGQVFVALQRLTNFEPAEDSSLVVIDGLGNQVLDEIPLSSANPFAKMRYSRTLDRIVVGLAGRFGKLDGGVELVNPGDHTTSGLVIGEETLGGDLVDVVIVSADRGFAVVSLPHGDGNSSTSLVAFDPSSGEMRAVLLAAEGYDYSFVELSPDGSQLWVSDRRRQHPGIRIFDVDSEEELTGEPLDVGLPPFMICFVP